MTWSLDGRPLRRILVSRLRYLGDVVMSTVVLEALRRGDPGVELGFLCESAAASVLASHPLLERLHVLGSGRRGRDARARSTHPRESAEGKGSAATVRDLRAAGYDLAVDLFFNPRSAVLLRASGIPSRFGGARSWRRRLYSHTVRSPAEVLPPEDWKRIAPGGLGDHLCRLGPLRHEETGKAFGAWLADEFQGNPLLPGLGSRSLGEDAARALAGIGVGRADSYLVLAPGATWPSKAWPARRWSELAADLASGRPEKIAVLTAPGAGASTVAIPGGRGGVLAALPLATALDVVAGARAVISVDGGIMHAAVGLGVPTVGLFGPTEPEVWFPYDRDGRFAVLSHRPPCHPCHLHQCGAFSCLPGLRPDEVAAALAGLEAVRVDEERKAAAGVEVGSEWNAVPRRKDDT